MKFNITLSDETSIEIEAENYYIKEGVLYLTDKWGDDFKAFNNYVWATITIVKD